MTIEVFLTHFTKTLFASDRENRLEQAAAEIALFFTVQAHEVAYFQFDSTRRNAIFRWPPQTRSSAPLPLKAFGSSLVSATARKEQGFVNNAFVTTPHLHMFEQLLAEPQQRLPIQKIMSVPVCRDTTPLGVIQVCRKGRSLDAAGFDFSQQDLENLQKISAVLARFEL